MHTEALFGSEHKFTLKEAILIYEESASSSTDGRIAATIHKVKVDKGVPEVDAGHPITLTAVENLAAALGTHIESELLPEEILSISMSQMVWWCPPSRRRIWFNPEKNAPGHDELKKLNGKFVQHPALLFIARRGLNVFALDTTTRPTSASKVFRAPYFNIDQGGHMCNGTARLPNELGPSTLKKYEAAFFNSAFSHSNWGHKLTTHPGAHLGLWQEMAERKKPFPTQYLLKTKMTVGSLLKPGRHSLD